MLFRNGSICKFLDSLFIKYHISISDDRDSETVAICLLSVSTNVSLIRMYTNMPITASIIVSAITTNKSNFRCNETVPKGFINPFSDALFIANYLSLSCESRLKGSIVIVARDLRILTYYLKFFHHAGNLVHTLHTRKILLLDSCCLECL